MSNYFPGTFRVKEAYFKGRVVMKIFLRSITVVVFFGIILCFSPRAYANDLTPVNPKKEVTSVDLGNGSYAVDLGNGSYAVKLGNGVYHVTFDEETETSKVINPNGSQKVFKLGSKSKNLSNDLISKNGHAQLRNGPSLGTYACQIALGAVAALHHWGWVGLIAFLPAGAIGAAIIAYVMAYGVDALVVWASNYC